MSVNAINNLGLDNQMNLDVNNLSKIGSASQMAKTAAVEKKVAENGALREDSFVKSKDTSNDSAGIYSRKSLIKQLMDSEEQRINAFQETLKSMLAGQGEKYNFSFMGKKYNVNEEQRAKAEAAVSKGGEYSVESVTDRIMSMAKALSGGDPDKIDKLQNAVVKGFEKATGMLGKKSLDDMPDITKKTYESVMKQFDDWKKSSETQETASKNNSASQTTVIQNAKKAPENNVAAQTEAASAAAISA